MAHTSPARTGWLIPAGLLLLSAVPIVAGALRLGQLAAGGPVTGENVRFFAVPLPVVVHIVGVTLYSVLGAFQFAPRFRRRHPGWHRVAGRVALPAGLAGALSGLWMTVFYPWPPGSGWLLAALRLVFGTAMAVSLVLALAAVRRRNFAAHRAWMIRGYAIALGAGTQVLTLAPWTLAAGPPGELAQALLMAAGWVINVVFAEWVIRRPAGGGRSRAGSGARFDSFLTSA